MAKFAMRLRIIRLGRDRVPGQRQGVVETVETAQDRGAVIRGLHQTGVKPYGLAKAQHRILGLAGPGKRDGEIVVRSGHGGIELDLTAESSSRPLPPAGPATAG